MGHFSIYVHVDLLSYFSGDSVVQECNNIEALSRDMGDSVQHYHCNNGTSAEDEFNNHCKASTIYLIYSASYVRH